MGIYVEILVRAPMEALWQHTQSASLHQRWDLRFTSIEPFGVATEGPQRFRYATRIGFGIGIDGEGEWVADRHRPGGGRVSALRFWSCHPLSLIQEGSGYWSYTPAPDGVRFLTWYDYRVRFGRLGRLLDRVAFRPLLGWATAWSFDRLRLWLERGLDPGQALRQAAIHAVARLGLVTIFLYQGIVPKLLAVHPDELAVLGDAGLGDGAILIRLLGVGEVGFAATLVVLWRRAAPAVMAAGFATVALAAVAIVSPRYLGAAFNPVSLNVALIGLTVVDVLALPDLPTAARCRRRPLGGLP
jgi:hypothetical protein